MIDPHQLYKKDTLVYVYFFNYDTATIYFEEYYVYNYEFMDGPQWHIIDTYKLYNIETTRKFFFFKSDQRHYIVRPSHLIHTDKEVSKVLFLLKIIDNYDCPSTSHLSQNILAILSKAKDELRKIEESFPEIIIKAFSVPVLVSDNNYNLWR